MICQKCAKGNANVHLTKIVNGEKTEYFLCEVCARAQGDFEFSFDEEFPLHQFFSDILEIIPPGGTEKLPREASEGLQCTSCGLTYAQFMQIGRLGCDSCYRIFSPGLHSLIRRLHGNQKHIGKVPARAGSSLKLKKEVERMRGEMQKKIYEEDFEGAAKLRDEIRQLEDQVFTGGEGLEE